MQPTAPPSTPPRANDLSDEEYAELDELLRQTPEPLEPLDAVMLDGFLCGVIVQPVLLEAAAWLPHVYDVESRPLPDDADAAWRERTQALILRRHTALNRAIVEDGWFDPLVLEPDDDAPAASASDATAADADADADDATLSAPPSDAEPDPLAGLSPVSRALMPWVYGFHHATVCFPDLLEMEDAAVDAALARLYRHLPADTDEEREVVETLDREHPLATLDEAMEELVVTVADLQDLTHEQRYRVETVRRETPKVGRNEPCPCHSGKKFKHCHGSA